jgi:rare lipoprotein A
MRWWARITIALLFWPLRVEALPHNPRRPAESSLQIQRAEPRTVQFGLASWYGPGFQRHITASGASFDDRELTAAHRTLRLGTKVKVTNLNNGRSVVVRVTDRGPWIRGRLIDVSRAAAERLGFKHRGLAPVKVTVIRNSQERHANGH